MRRLLTAMLALATAVPLLGSGVAVARDGADDYDVQVRRTTNGIPHIEAEDYGSLGFGYGYVFAEDNICTAADFYVTVNGERSKFFGPDGSWTFQGNGSTFGNLDTDFYFAAVNEAGIVEEHLAKEPPLGPRPEIKTAVQGYVDGYNAYLASVGGTDGVTDPRCAGEPWVRPIRPIDAYRRFYQLASLASAGVAFDGIGQAQPPGAGLPLEPFAGSAREAAALDLVNAPGTRERFDEILGGVGSNAYGFGRDVTDNGKGMVLGNPHFPWQGGERLYQTHLTIPGTLDVAGASLLGVPINLIGTTEGLAWSHTVSTARRFTIFQMTLNPLDPTQYAVGDLAGGEFRDMQAHEAVIEVLQEDGTLAEQSRTLYRTEFGWMLTSILGLPIFPWTPAVGFALGDANDHLRYLNHFFEKNLAQSVDELQELTDRNMGVPWVNTIAADRDGNAYYADVSAVPHVTDEKVQTCSTPGLGQATQEALRVVILNSLLADCGWGTDPDAPVPGIFGPGSLPRLVRGDYVTNSNDSHWLTNPEEPLEGYDLIIGDEGAERSTRTRNGLVQVQQRLDGSDEYTSTPANTMTQDILKDIVFNNRQYPGELVRDDLVAMCESLPGGMAPSSGSGTTSTTQEGIDACQVLADWDLREDLDSNGAILFRRFWGHASSSTLGPWQVPFDESDPVHTPNTLNTASAEVQAALGDAINDLVDAGIPLDAPLRGWQYEDLGDGEQVPIHGGPGTLGNFNAINVTWDGDPSDGASGYPAVRHGSSFVMATQFVDPAANDGCGIDADSIVTYSQSENVNSPHLNDQTRMYATKTWNPMLFCEQEILADPNLQTVDLEGVDRRPGGVTVQPIEDRTVESATNQVFRATTGGDVSSVSWDFGDGRPPVDGERVEHVFRTTGNFPATVTVTASNGAVAVDTFRVTVTDDAVIDRVAGPDRVATAIEVSQAAAPTADVAILARSDDFPDALAGSALSVAAGAPVLLTPPDALPATVEAELSRLGVRDVIVLGGEVAISTNVTDRLADLGLAVERVAGDDRFATAARIARRVGAATTGEVVLTLGETDDPSRVAWADALSAGALAASPDRPPVLLTRTDAIPAETLETLEDLGTEQVLLLGGTVAISDAVEAQLRELGYGVTRFAGADRYDTSALVTTEAMRRWGRDRQVFIALVTGENFPDGLAAAGLAGTRDGVVLLTPPAVLEGDGATSRVITTFADQFDRGAVLGGTTAVSDAVRTAATAAAGG